MAGTNSGLIIEPNRILEAMSPGLFGTREKGTGLMVETLAFFAILLAGYLAARFRFLPEGTFEGLAQYVFAVAAPLYVFRTMTRSSVIDKAAGDLVGLVVLYILVAALVMVIGIAVARYILNARTEDQERIGIAASHSNVVLLGLPAALMVLDTKAVSALMVLVGMHGLTMALLRTGARKLRKAKTPKPGAEIVEQLQSPIFIGLVLGIVLAKLDIGLSGQVDDAIRVVALSAVPCALFAFGGILARQKLDRATERLQRDAATAVAKLTIFPFLIWLLAKPIGLFGLPTSWIWMAVILAAMPPGFELLAKGKRANGEPSGATILNISLVAIVTTIIIAAMMR